MDIFLHTYGRPVPARQHTLRALRGAGVPVTVVVQAREAPSWAWYSGPLCVLPEHITTLSVTRDYLIHDERFTDNKVVFLDDDLHFFVRRDDEPTKFRSPSEQDLRNMMTNFDIWLGTHPHVGIAPREGGNRDTRAYLHNTRIMRVLAYRRDYLRKHAITFAPLVVMEDFHVNLQVLKSGADTLVLNNYCSNQAEGSDAPGGCSHYRTSQVQTASAHLLAKIHKPYVRVVEKTTKTAWGGGTRTDVVISWKKAREHSSLLD